MAVAYDAFSNATSGTGTLSWTHTPVGTPKGVFVWVVAPVSTNDEVTGVTYGGVSMTEIASSPLVRTVGETSVMYGYFLGSNLGTGGKTVEVSVSGSAVKYAWSVTVTASGDTELENHAVLAGTSEVTNPEVSLALNSETCFVALGLSSGDGAVSDISPRSGWSERYEVDTGQQLAGCYTYDTIGSTNVTAGYDCPYDDASIIAIAIKEAATGGATLTPALFEDGDTFHAATVSVGAVTLTPALFSDADTFHAAAVSQGGAPQTLTPTLYADADTFHAATVSPGSVTLTPALYSDGETFHAATVSQGGAPQTLTPTLYADADTFHTATVSNGAVTLTPTLFSDGDTFHAATVSRGAVTLTPALVSDGDTFYTHAVVLEGGPQTLSPEPVVDGDTFHAATVTPGAVTLTPSLYTDADTFHAAEIASGFNLQPAAYADPDTFYPATVTRGAVTLVPSLFEDADTFHAPSVFLGVRRTVEILTAAARDTTLTAASRDTLLESRHAVHG